MTSQIRYDNQVAVVTGAGNGLGKQYAKFLASRGAKVVVNDLGGTFNGSDAGGRGDSRVADVVVKEITNAGGMAVANYDPVQNGENIIRTAIDAFGRVDILINNAGVLRDITLRNMKTEDWDIIMDVHVHGAMKTARAAWPHMRKQRYGRIINTSSSSGLFGNFGQANYAAAKMALVGFNETLAKEGAKYNIYCNVLAPSAASRLTQTVWTSDMMEVMKPDWVVPLVGVLVSQDCKESGSIFEAAAGHYSKIRWERSKGFLAHPETLSPDLVLQNYSKIVDWTGADYPDGAIRAKALYDETSALPKSSDVPAGQVSFKGRVVLVTGGGAGLGRAYAIEFAKLGARVVVNDVKNADKVADEIKSAGGDALGLTMSVEEGEVLIRKVLDTYGRIDVLVNNAGILRDKAFVNMTDAEWLAVMSIHLRSAFLLTRAAWPHMTKQRFGRIVNITSTSGIYGNFGQANYAAAKCGLIGFTKTTAREGAKYNIVVNAVAPSAGTNMTRTVWAEEDVKAVKPDYVAPLVAALCSEKPPSMGQLYEAGSGWFAATRWQRARGVEFPVDQDIPTVEKLAEAFPEICNFDNGKADNPDTPQDGGRWSMENILRNPKISLSQEDRANRKYITKIQNAISMKPTPTTYTYSDRDVILYNLSLGARRTQLDLVYENSNNFQALPTFGIVPNYHSTVPWQTKDIIPNYDQRMLLHGEQYLEIKQFPIPTSGTTKTEAHLIEVVDKGNAALVRRGSTTFDGAGKPLFYTESLAFIRGSGGFGGQKKPSDRGAATAPNDPPTRAPDHVAEEKTSEDIAALYRLMGDKNPLHIDPKFSSVGGFKVPILHGLATFGITGKHVFQTYGPFKNIKVRFSGTVLPGQTIVTEMWKEGRKVIYRAKVKETGKGCISNAAVELLGAKSTL
ncbi:peroxisomal hydratase-dehydrogenase-epimerase [Exophiala viscosa]|uniref:Peroxisomal hydratase-dehydrogenase-epimerase n=1 Tax=Exophiala viscosa TaxID=2486360 RepID=A0AAN6DVP2_9EURO|nr:peroxisomal hydratase-dehydrogenase-epimerase [Exophiala viscosa]